MALILLHRRAQSRDSFADDTYRRSREALGRVEGRWGRARCKQLGWLSKVQLSHFLWELCRIHLSPVWEPHLSLLKLEQNVEAFAAYQERTFSQAGFAALAW